MNQSREYQFKQIAELVVKNITAKLSLRKIDFIAEGNFCEVLDDLLIYFLHQKGKLSEHKGIFLFGKIGCGKSMLLYAIREVLSQVAKCPFAMGFCRDIVSEFNSEGFEALTKYKEGIEKINSRNHAVITPVKYYFDDLGAEQDGWYYGNKVNVMADIFLCRYKNFQWDGLVTHCSSNFGFDGNEIERRYGALFRSRAREMFNFVELSGNDKRK